MQYLGGNKCEVDLHPTRKSCNGDKDRRGVWESVCVGGGVSTQAGFHVANLFTDLIRPIEPSPF